MITKMTKYSFLLFHKEVSSFLEGVQELGLVDITRENRAIDDHSKIKFELLKRYSSTEKAIKEIYNKISEQEYPHKKADISNPEELLNLAETSIQLREDLNQKLKLSIRDREEAYNWGEFNREDIDKIESLGYRLHYFSISNSNFQESWENEYILHILSKSETKTYFVILNPKEAELNFKYQESKFPESSYHIIDRKIDECKDEIEDNNSTLIYIYNNLNLLDKGATDERSELELYLAGKASAKEAEGTIAILTGFAPADKRDELISYFDNSGIYYLSQEAKADDNPPIKLKNNFFSKLFEPIGELYMLPKYGELDLTPYFAPFYMLFFGFCLGDMGYGLVLLIAATIGKMKIPSMKGYLSLVQLLGIGSIIMPMLSGTMFGTNITTFIPLPDSVTGLFFSDLKMFWFAIIFGLFQLVFARIVSAIDSMIRKGWQYGMHNIGWAIVIVWASLAYAGSMNSDLIIPKYVNYIGLGGLGLILLFSATEGNILSRIMKGTFALYDITGIFGDMLSYIRLFGLGTSGGILGMVVNSVAMNMLGVPYVGWLFTGIMLLFGHTAVLLLSSLGAFVHPMRLTFVEFYKNAGFEGGGKEFRPLSKKQL